MNETKDIVKLAFGLEADLVFSNISFVYSSLQSESWEKRFASLKAIVSFWKIDDTELEDLCESVFLKDPDVRVRSIAIRILGDVAKKTKAAERLRFLASIALTPSYSNDERRSAYFALLEIDHGATSSVSQAITDIIENRLPAMDVAMLKKYV